MSVRVDGGVVSRSVVFDDLLDTLEAQSDSFGDGTAAHPGFGCLSDRFIAGGFRVGVPPGGLPESSRVHVPQSSPLDRRAVGRL